MESRREAGVGVEEVEEQCDEPVSPTGQYFSSSTLSISILGVLESEVLVEKSHAMTLLKDLFLPINRRFSSIMVTDDRGVKQWKSVRVNLEDHVKLPVFPNGLSPESYDTHLQDYMSKIVMDLLPKNKPLWELHIINYPTSNAAATVIFKLHHALGDGYSLMAAIFSILKRADDPSLPLTFPSLRSNNVKKNNILKSVTSHLSMFLNTTSDFVLSFLKSTVVVDDQTPIRSATKGVEFGPITISTTTFPLDQIKQIKSKLGGTVNDIVLGTVFYGIRLYMQSVSKGSNNARSTALVLLNTRAINGYHTVEQMLKPNAKATWGNQFAFLHIPIPNSTNAETENPLTFISEANKMTTRKKNSLAVYLTGRLLEMIRLTSGPEAASRYVYKAQENASVSITNLIGPIEQMAVGNYRCKGMYFMVVNTPMSLTVTMLSYMGKLRVAVGAEKDFIDQKRLLSCLEKAFQEIFQAALAT